MEPKIQEEVPENKDTIKPEAQEPKNDGASSPSSSSASDDSSKSSQDNRGAKENDNEKRQASRSKSPRRASKSKSRSKERRSGSRSESRDNSENDRKDRGKKYRGDEKFDSKPQNYRGGYQKYREGYHNGGSRSRSRSPNDRRFRHGDKKQTFISKPTLDGPLWTFRQFMESQRTDVDPSKAEKVYEKYKKEYEEKQNKIFFAEHKSDEWFKEKYDVILSEKLKEERKAEDRSNTERFLAALREGGFEGLNLNYEEYEHKNLMTENIPKANNEPVEEEKEPSKAINNFTEIGLEASLDITGAPFFGFDPNSQTLFIKSIPKFISRWDLTEALKKLNGFLSLSLSEPLKSQEFIRFGWILFDTEDNCNKAYEFLKTLNIKNFAFNIVKSRSQRKSVKICENMDKERITTDLDLSRQLIYALDDEKDIKNNALLKNAPQVDPSKQLDLQILYLRKVHSYCFYCAAEYIDERMLAAKCGPIHLRRFKLENQEPIPDLPDWHKRISEIVKVRIEESTKKVKRNPEDIEKNAEEMFDVELRNKCEKISIKHGNWPCKYCHKIFKADHFVVKHVKTKHGEKYDKIREKKMYENYASDKNKITSTFASSYSQRGYGRPQGQQGYKRYNNQNRGGYHGQRPHRPFEYKDLDDPKVAQVRTSRPVIDYGDL